MRAMILADNEKDRRAALKKLLPLQRKDFAGVFKAMDGLPVTIRTLDPPLHEFLPRREDLMVEIAMLPYAHAKAEERTGGEIQRLRRQGRRRSEEALAHAAGACGAVARVQSHARTSRLPSRHHVSGNHRDAGARDFRGGRRLHEEGNQGASGSHDSAGRHGEGNGEPGGDRAARGRRSIQREGKEESSTWSAR